MNAQRAILFDIDGTILDVREKYWAAHCFLARELGEDPGDRPRFWAMKRRRAAPFQILAGWRRSSVRAYGKEWPEIVEDRRFTVLDEPFPQVLDTLEVLGASDALVAITMRRHPGPLLDALAIHGIDRRLDGIVLLGSVPNSIELDKPGLLRSSPYAGLRFHCVIGDSDDDIALARSLGCQSVLVLSGLRDRSYLTLLHPDAILDDVTDLPGFLQDRNGLTSHAIRPAHRQPV